MDDITFKFAFRETEHNFDRMSEKERLRLRQSIKHMKDTNTVRKL